MKSSKRSCKAITVKGVPCKNIAHGKEEYCRTHLRQRRTISKLLRTFNKHKEGIWSLLVGAMADPVASDIYDFLKEKFGLKHIAPYPIPTPEKIKSDLQAVSQHYKANHDCKSLIELARQVSLGMDFTDVVLLLGGPPLPTTGGATAHLWYLCSDGNEGLEIIFDPDSNWGVQSGTVVAIRFAPYNPRLRLLPTRRE